LETETNRQQLQLSDLKHKFQVTCQQKMQLNLWQRKYSTKNKGGSQGKGWVGRKKCGDMAKAQIIGVASKNYKIGICDARTLATHIGKAGNMHCLHGCAQKNIIYAVLAFYLLPEMQWQNQKMSCLQCNLQTENYSFWLNTYCSQTRSTRKFGTIQSCISGLGWVVRQQTRTTAVDKNQKKIDCWLNLWVFRRLILIMETQTSYVVFDEDSPDSKRFAFTIFHPQKQDSSTKTKYKKIKPTAQTVKSAVWKRRLLLGIIIAVLLIATGCGIAAYVNDQQSNKTGDSGNPSTPYLQTKTTKNIYPRNETTNQQTNKH